MKENKAVEYSIIFIAIVVLGIVLRELAGILRPLAVAFFMTVLIMPLYSFAKRKKIPAWIPITGVFLILLFSFYLLGGLLSSEVSRFETNSEEYTQQIASGISIIMVNTNVDFDKFNVQTILSSQAGKNIISNSVSAIGTIFTELLLAIIFAIFMIPAYRKVMQKMKKKKKFQESFQKIQQQTLEYLRTKTIVSLGTGITSGLVLILFQSDFVWTLSIIVFLFNFVPNVGSAIAVLLAAALYALKFGIGVKFFVVVGLLIFLQQVWGNIIEPKLAGKKLQLSPLLILISLFFWGWLWGIGGMIISVPILTVLKIIFEHFKSTKHIAEYMQ